MTLANIHPQDAGVERRGACSSVWLERPAHNRVAVGSNPARPTFLPPILSVGLLDFHCCLLKK